MAAKSNRPNAANSQDRFREYAFDWIETRRVGGRPLAPKTKDLYRILLRVHILPQFGDHPVTGIQTDEVRKWQATFDSPMVSAKAYRLLRTILATAVEDDRIESNPCRIRGAGIERSSERPIIGPEKVIELSEEIAGRYRALVLLAGFGGLRLGELLALRRKHVDIHSGIVVVNEQLVTLVGGHRIITEPKTHAGKRKVSLPSLVVDALEQHLRSTVRPDEDALLFTGEDGGFLPATTFYNEWRATREACGVPQLHVHDLRHAAGTLAAWTGATQRELMARLGHASPAAAIRYQHATADRDRAIASGLDDLIKAVGTRKQSPRTVD